MSTHVDVFQEPDLVALLADEPELLAVADAIATTRPIRRRRLAWPALLAAVVAATVGFVAANVWEGEGKSGLVERALAAVGEGPIVHAVIREPTGHVYVELATGKRTPQLREIETWFDQGRRLEHTIIRVDGRMVEDMLQSPEGGLTAHGPIYTCRWILAHPAKAKEAGVSCDPSNADRYQGPVLDPALEQFVGGYREALERGSVKRVGSAVVEGRNVAWFSIALARGGAEEVAVDEETGRPLRVRTIVNGEHTRVYDVLVLEALEAGEGDFDPPTRADALPASGQVSEADQIEPAEAPASVPGALWPGPTVDGLELEEVELHVLTTGFGPDSGKPVERGVGVELVYGEKTGTPFHQVRIQQSAAPQIAYAWHSYDDPPEGTVLLGFFGGWLRKDGVYVRIWSHRPDVVLEVARALRPIER